MSARSPWLPFPVCLDVGGKVLSDPSGFIPDVVTGVVMVARAVATKEEGLGGSKAFSMGYPLCLAMELYRSRIYRRILCSPSTPEDTVRLDREMGGVRSCIQQIGLELILDGARQRLATNIHHHIIDFSSQRAALLIPPALDAERKAPRVLGGIHGFLYG